MGTLQDQQDIFLSGTEAKLNKLKATWEDLYEGIADDNQLQSAIGGITNVIQTIDNFVDSFGGGLGALSAIAVQIASIFNNQINNAIANAIINNQRYSENLDILKQKIQYIEAGVARNEGGVATPAEASIQAGLAAQLQYAQQISVVRKNITQQQYQELTAIQQKIGEIEREVTLDIETANQKALQAGLDEESLRNAQESYDFAEQNVNAIVEENRLLQTKTQEIANQASSSRILAEELVTQEGIWASLDSLARNFYNSLTGATAPIEGISAELQQEFIDLVNNLKTNQDILETEEGVLTVRDKILNVIRKIHDEQLASEASAQGQADALREVIEAQNRAADRRLDAGLLTQDFNRQMSEIQQRTDIAEKVTVATTALSSFVTTWGSIRMMMQTINDETASFGDKLFQSLMTASMAIPMLVSGFKKLNDITGVSSNLLRIRNAQQTISNALTDTNITTSQVLQGIVSEETLTEELYNKRIQERIVSEGILETQVTQEMIAEERNAAAQQAHILITEEATVANESLTASLLKSPYFWVTVAVVGLTAAIAALVSHQEKLQKQREEDLKTQLEQGEAFEKENDKIQELIDKYREAYEVYKDTGENKDELNEISKDISEQYGVEADALDALIGKYDKYNEALKKRKEKELQNDIDALDQQREAIEGQIEDANTKRSLWNKVFGGNQGMSYRLGGDMGDRANQQVAARIQQIANETPGATYGSSNQGWAVQFSDASAIEQFRDKAKAALEDLKETMSETELAGSKTYQNLKQWIGDSEELFTKLDEIDQKALDKKTELQTSIVDFGEVDGLNDFIQKYDELEQYIANLPENVGKSSEEITSIVESQISESGKVAETELEKFKLLESVIEHFGGEVETKAKNLLDSLSEEDLQVAYTMDVDEIESFDNFERFIEKVKNEAKRQEIVYNLDVTNDSIDTLLQQKELDEDQLALLEELEEEYPELGRIQDKYSSAYLEKLIQIREALEEAQIAIDEQSASLDIDEFISKYHLDDPIDIPVSADDEEFKQTMEDIADKEYAVVVDVKADVQSDFDTVVETMDNIEDMASKIGDDFIVAAEDIEELNNAFPGVLDEMTVLKDGTVQLNREVVNAAVDGANAEVAADTQATIEKLRLTAEQLETKRKAALKIAEVAKQLGKSEEKTETLTTKQKSKLSKAFNDLDQKNSKKTAVFKQESNNTVVDNASTSASRMVNIYAAAYRAMADDSAEWARIAQQNNKAAAEKSGGITRVGNFHTGYASESGTGTVSTPELKSLEDFEEAAEDASTNWDEVAEQYTNLADAIGKAENEITGKVGELTARTISVGKNLDNVGKGSGSDGKKDSSKSSSKKNKGKSSKKKKDKEEPDVMDKIEDDTDRFHNIDHKIDDITEKLDKLADKEDKLFGKKLIKDLNDQTKILEKQIKAYQKKIDLAIEERKELRKSLKKEGVEFNEDNEITNYNAIIKQKEKEVNKLIDRYNNMSAKKQKKFKDTVEQAKKELEELQADMEEYEKLEETKEELRDAIREDEDRITDIAIQKFNLAIELELDIHQAEKDWNDFKKKVFQGIEEDDIFGNALFGLSRKVGKTGTRIEDVQREIRKIALGGVSELYNSAEEAEEELIKQQKEVAKRIAETTDIGTYFQSDGSGLIQDLTRQVNDTLEQLKKQAKGEDNVFGDDRAAGLETLNTYRNELMTSLEEYVDYVNEIKDSYKEMMDEAKQAFDDQASLLSFIDETLQHDINLISLLQGDEAYDKLGRYYELQRQNNLERIEFQRSEIDFWENQMELAEEGSEEWETSRENWVDATKDWQDLVEQSIEVIQDKYLNSINEIFQNLNDKVTNGLGLDYIQEQWNLINENADQYLDSINSAYEIQALEEKYKKGIAGTDDVKAQQKLTDIMNEELAGLREKDKLTQYDIDRANLKYQIALKQAALDDAQNAKTMLRLRRDSQGNYVYQFVADEESVDSAKQDLEDLKNQLYNFDKQAYTDNLNQMYQAWNDYQQKMYEASQINDPEERLAREKLLTEQYGELINGLVEQNEDIRTNLKDSAIDEYADLYNLDIENFKNMTDTEVDEFMNNLVPQWNSGVQQMTDTFANEGGLIPTCEDAFRELSEVTQQYEDDLDSLQQTAGVDFNDIYNGIDNVATKTRDLTTDTQTLFDTYESNLSVLQKVIDKINQLTTAYREAYDAALNASQASYNYEQSQNKKAANNYWDTEGHETSSSSTFPLPTVQGSFDTAWDLDTKTEKAVSDTAKKSNSSKKPETYFEPIEDSSSKKKKDDSSSKKVTASNISKGDKLIYTGGAYYETSEGDGKHGERGPGKKVTVNKLDKGAKYPIHVISDNSAYGWLKASQLQKLLSGGYTGDWNGNEGRVAMLHKKELVLNAEDTSNILAAVSAVRDMSFLISSLNGRVMNNVSGFNLSGINSQSITGGGTLDQNVHIEASFPNVRDSNEIESALRNLVNVASMKAYSNRR